MIQLHSRVPSGPIELKWDKHRFEMKLVNPANKRKYTVIIVGSGLAGASAAATLSELAWRSGVPRRTLRILADAMVANYVPGGMV